MGLICFSAIHAECRVWYDYAQPVYEIVNKEGYREALQHASPNAMQDSLSSDWLEIGRRYVPKSAELSISPRSATC